MFYTRQFIENTLRVDRLPEYLYHYTSIETFALILNSQKLRFSRLDTVNDPEEARAADLKYASTLVFASCWTEEEDELIAMWKLYTPDMQGIRLKMPTNLFAGQNPPQVEEGGAIQFFDGNIEILRKPPATGIMTNRVFGPNKVHYTDDEDYLIPNCIIEHNNFTEIVLHDLGKAKNPYWSFEREWRFLLYGIPSEIRVKQGSGYRNIILDLEEYPVLETAYYLPLDASAIKKAEILLGPRINKAQEILVKTLRDTYCPKVPITKSRLKVR